GGRLDAVGNPPQGQAHDRSLPIFAGALVAVPLVVLLFQNLMQASAVTPGEGLVGYLLALPLMGKLLFGAFLVGVPGILA
ncbi:hypothetical protein, partial [Salmonella enterica]|uniref:hypothetical protein n=1 Tax=Salmonella enterica TaxID=28901 RepID=UPI003D284974